MALADQLDVYLARRAAGAFRPATVKIQRQVLGRFVAWLTAQGHQRWTTVTGAQVDGFLLHLTEAGWRASSRKTAANALRRFGDWLVEAGAVLRDPTADVHLPDADEDPLPPAPLSEEQVATLFATVGRASVVDLRIRCHLELLYSCALRNSEAVHLDVTDLDLDARTVLVRDGKGGKTRMLPLLAGTMNAAADYLALRRELLKGPDHGALLLAHSGRRLPKGWMQGYLAGLSRTIGFHVYPHLLRHSIAVHLLRRGADIRYIQNCLGHKDLEMTKVYLRLVPGQLREDYDAAMPVFPVQPPSSGNPAVVASPASSTSPGADQ
ncbi:MAG: tyrosine-type recombinase/integrase [Planctomycetes bacterium]|nr:tyrosine-type recombinase/integrase [Planctomycetota bacterium]